MFDRVGSLAERVATNLSRRAFLGHLGQGALGLAAVIGGILAFPANAEASGNLCCLYPSLSGGFCFHAKQGSCPSQGVLVVCKQYPGVCPG
jgi:hypothetical protein